MGAISCHDDPADHVHSGHRELIGACRPRVVDRRATLRSFGSEANLEPGEDSLLWVRQVAEARWAADDVFRLPWWATARSEEEIADAHRHPSATTFDGRRPAEERAELELDKHRNSVTKWLNRGLRLEGDEPGSKDLLDRLSAAVSRRSRRACKCGSVYVVPIQLNLPWWKE